MKGFVRSPVRTLALAIVLAGSAMCSHDNIIGPENQLLVSLDPDNFQFKVSNLARVSQSVGYTWVNTGVSASVSNSSNLIGGTTSVTVRGPTGTVLYQSDLLTNGASSTMTGTAGNWEILFTFSKTDGNVTFQLQRAP